MRAHDLVEIARAGIARLAESAPPWVSGCLALAPWAVVRRAPASGDFVPAGVRGSVREQRYACEIGLDEIVRIVRPEELASMVPLRDMPAIRAFNGFRDRASREGFAWGPAGSLGFELASGFPVVTENSDCDIVLRAKGLPLSKALAVAQLLDAFEVRLDIELDFGEHAVALRELSCGVDRVMVKTSQGPQLVAWTTLF